MSKEKTDQRHLTHRGRRFHFVSYEGIPANPGRLQLATGPAWFLMSAGKRWSVMPNEPGLGPDELDQQLTHWLDDNVFP